MALLTRVYNNYGSFTVESGTWTYPGAAAKIESPQAWPASNDGEISFDFELSAPANIATIFLESWRLETTLARAKVILDTPGGSHTLYNATGTQGWTAILHYVDIVSYLDQAGSYTLRLLADTETQWIIERSSVMFGVLDLKADTDPPAQVTGVQATPMTTTRIVITWNPAQAAETYNLFYKTSSSGWTKVSGISTEHYNLTGLDACTLYTFRVSAVNVSGTGVESSDITQRTHCVFTLDLSDTFGSGEAITKTRTARTTPKDFTETASMGETFLVAYGVLLDDPLSIVEDFALRLITTFPMPLSEAMPMVELLTMVKTTPLDTNEEKLLAGKTDTMLYEFVAGTATGVYDTPDLDFGQPGMEKTLDLVAVTSSAVAPHTVSLYVSVDGGVTYTLIGTFVVQTGITGYFYPWITGEKFRLRFQGDGMYLDTIRAQAIPRGKDIVETGKPS